MFYNALYVKNIHCEDEKDETTIATKATSFDNDDGLNDNSNRYDNDSNLYSSLLLPDAFAIILACQLMGLLDIVNDPQFTQAGGWFQPIPAMPSTLRVLMQRVALLSILWMVSTSIASSATSKTVKEEDSLLTVNEWQPLAVFGFLRVLERVISTAWLSSPNRLLESTDWLAISLRDVYFVALFILTLRFLYKKYFLC
jgi:hypothetical protein